MHGFWFAVIRKQIIMAISNGVRLENYCLLNHNNRIRDKIDSYISRKDYMNSDKKNKTWNVVNCKKRFHIKLFNDKNAVNTGVRHRNWFQFFNFMKSILVLLGLRAIDLKKNEKWFPIRRLINKIDYISGSVIQSKHTILTKSKQHFSHWKPVI